VAEPAEILAAAAEALEQASASAVPEPWAAVPSDFPGEWKIAHQNPRTGAVESRAVATTHGLNSAPIDAALIAMLRNAAPHVVAVLRDTADLVARQTCRHAEGGPGDGMWFLLTPQTARALAVARTILGEEDDRG